MLEQRLQSHLLTPHNFTTPAEIIQHYGCLQAQVIPQAKRCIASRLPKCTDQEIHDALVNGSIVRTRPMRGTLHYMDPKHVHWMLDLCASKTLKGFEKRRAFLGITDAQAHKALELMESELSGGNVISRTEMGELLQAGGLPMEKGRLYHLTCYAGTRGLICFGPPGKKDDTFVMLDERVKQPMKLSYEEQLITLANMYIRSHGPCTMDDLARWTGLGKRVCKQALVLLGDEVERVEEGGRTYYVKKISPAPSFSRGESVYVLGGFDEYFLGYKDRMAVAKVADMKKYYTVNGIFYPLILVDGKVVGYWKAKMKSNTVDITCTMIDSSISIDKKLLKKRIDAYALFL